jgi:hypothetical protein
VNKDKQTNEAHLLWRCLGCFWCLQFDHQLQCMVLSTASTTGSNKLLTHTPQCNTRKHNQPVLALPWVLLVPPVSPPASVRGRPADIAAKTERQALCACWILEHHSMQLNVGIRCSSACLGVYALTVSKCMSTTTAVVHRSPGHTSVISVVPLCCVCYKMVLQHMLTGGTTGQQHLVATHICDESGQHGSPLCMGCLQNGSYRHRVCATTFCNHCCTGNLAEATKSGTSDVPTLPAHWKVTRVPLPRPLGHKNPDLRPPLHAQKRQVQKVRKRNIRADDSCSACCKHGNL